MILYKNKWPSVTYTIEADRALVYAFVNSNDTWNKSVVDVNDDGGFSSPAIAVKLKDQYIRWPMIVYIKGISPYYSLILSQPKENTDI